MFRNTLAQWEADVRRFRCSLSADELKTLREPDPPGTPWDCRDVRFELGVIRFSDLDSARADQLNRIPTRLTLPAADIDAAIEAGRDAALLNAPLQRYRAERGSVTSPGDR